MWWVGTETIDVYLASGNLAWRRADGASRWALTDGSQAGVELLEAWLNELQGRVALRLWLSGRLACPFILNSPAGLKNWRELEKIAQVEARDVAAWNGDSDVWIEKWPRESGVLAAAVERSLLEQIRRLRKRVRSVRPWWNAVLNGLPTNGALVNLLLVDEPDSFTVLAESDSQYCSAASHLGFSPEQRSAAQSRVTLASAVPPEQRIRAVLVDGTALEETRAATNTELPFAMVWSRSE